MDAMRLIDAELSEALRRGIAKGSFDYPAIEKLLRQGGDPCGRIRGEDSLLHALAGSVAEGSEIMARLLLSFGADPALLDVFGAQPLARAAMSGNVAVGRELLRCGADPRARDPQGGDAMRGALERGDHGMAQELLEAGYPARGCKGLDGTPALACVAESFSGNSLAFELIHGGADPNEAGPKGWTPLAVACRAGNAPMASLLISEGAAPWGKGPSGLTPMSIALGARPGAAAAGPMRVTPGHLACAGRIARVAAPGWGFEADAKGMPALARLCKSIGRFEHSWMQALRGCGASPLARCADGSSLLSLCAGMSSEKDAMALADWALAAGVDPSWACRKGALPEQRAAAKKMWLVQARLCSERERRQVGSAAAGAAPRGAARL